MRMTGTRQLVEDVLDTLPKPYTEDVVDDVFHAIEERAEWRRRYDVLVTSMARKVVQARAAFWIANYVGRSVAEEVSAQKSTLIETYPKLKKPGEKRGKKMKEPEALKAMSTYYQANRAGLPASISSQRDVIVEMLMEGYSVEDAFSKAK
jgi:hypothetical protein